MIIILEGCDKTGKSTLARYIADKYNFDYIKCSAPKGDAFLEYMNILDNIERNTVIDRFHVGESVYGPIYRGRCDLTDDDIVKIEFKCNSLNALLVYCYDTPENIAKRFEEDGETFTQKEHIETILNEYERLLDFQIIPLVKHSISENDLMKSSEIDRLIEEMTFKRILKDLNDKGKESSPRGLKIKEILNYQYTLPPRIRFCNFPSRKLNLNYIKREFEWYLYGDKFDTSICKHASMWKKLVNKDGSINSNYGQYIFGEQDQITRVADVLVKDKDSRRACIVILNNDHLEMETNDIPCTYSINFHIRENRLYMTVNMRSQDAMFGMGNDAPFFSFLHEIVYNTLIEYYKDLKLGDYTHNADSFHVYERHFEDLEAMLYEDLERIEVPQLGEIKEFYNWIKK